MGIWHRYETLRPGQLARVVAETPVVYWPLGLLEHHGHQLPVGFDGLKAEAVCRRLAARVGGVILPTMWWGGGGGHGPFPWTLYQDETAAARIVEDSLARLRSFGFLAFVLLMGHYPWSRTLREVLTRFRASHPGALMLAGTEMDIAAPEAVAAGDHAAREETSYGLALLPEWVDLSAMAEGPFSPAWPGGKAPEAAARHPNVDFDPASPTFAQMGVSAALATAARGESQIGPVIDALERRLRDYLRHAAPSR